MIVLVLSWLIPILALLIKLDSKGPVFFKQKRMGLNGSTFTCIKLRTMIVNEEADESPAILNDHRITRIGQFLRSINLDELPQFFNVFIGTMSIVGPRPHMTADCIRFSFVISSYQFRNLMRPGITGLAQINGYHGPTDDYESIIVRYYWDAQYIRKANLWLDCRILVVTFMQSLKSFLAIIFKKSRKGFKVSLEAAAHNEKNKTA
jgi:putative colanic acid biosynthesis UDP-glucose lipid carrier transferase